MMARHPKIDIIVEPASERLRVESTYDVAFINGLKQNIPPRARSWDELGRVWYVALEYETVLRQLALMYPRAHWVEGQQETDLHTGRVVTRTPPAEQLSLL
jgi:hypothetical protein